MSDFPLACEDQRFQTGTTPNSGGMVITTSATPNVEGAYTEIIASSTFHACAVMVTVFFNPTDGTYLLDIAIGAAASEQIIFSNLYGDQGSNVTSRGYYIYYFPIEIPAGTRISARAQGSGVSLTPRVQVHLISSGFNAQSSYGRVITYGANDADSGGVQVDPGGTINTDGAYTEIVASTTFPHAQIIIAFGGQGNQIRTSCTWLVDIAIGASGSEQVIIPDLLIATGSVGEIMYPGTLPPMSIKIPEGSRISARARCSINDATDRLFDILIYAVG